MTCLPTRVRLLGRCGGGRKGALGGGVPCPPEGRVSTRHREHYRPTASGIAVNYMSAGPAAPTPLSLPSIQPFLTDWGWRKIIKGGIPQLEKKYQKIEPRKRTLLKLHVLPRVRVTGVEPPAATPFMVTGGANKECAPDNSAPSVAFSTYSSDFVSSRRPRPGQPNRPEYRRWQGTERGCTQRPAVLARSVQPGVVSAARGQRCVMS